MSLDGLDGIVLVHGAMCTSRCWDPIVASLGLPAIAVDLPGRTGRPADLATVTLEDCVTAVLDGADQAGFDRCALVGHSLGGVTITETAWQHPNRVAELIYVAGIVPAPRESASLILFGADLPPRQPAIPNEVRARALLGNDLTDEQWTDQWNAMVPEAAGLWNARVNGYPERLPMTYVSMTDDVGVPPVLAEQMIANLRGTVDHRVLPGGHMAMVTKPRELATIINDVLGQRET